MAHYIYQVAVLTKFLNQYGFLGIEYYQCATLRAVGCLKSLLINKYPDSRFRVYQIFAITLSDLKDDNIPQSRVVLIDDGF